LTACDGTEEVRGVLVAVESRSLTRVDSITLRLADGTERRFGVEAAPEASSHLSSPGHLREHMTHGDVVTVRFRRANGTPVATSIRDE
jgi:hypothetical protein